MLRFVKVENFARTESFFLLFEHQVYFHIEISLWQLREANCHFSYKSVVTITHEQNMICSKTQFDGITCDQNIICRQSFVSQVVGFRPMSASKNNI